MKKKQVQFENVIESDEESHSETHFPFLCHLWNALDAILWLFLCVTKPKNILKSSHCSICFVLDFITSPHRFVLRFKRTKWRYWEKGKVGLFSCHFSAIRLLPSIMFFILPPFCLPSSNFILYFLSGTAGLKQWWLNVIYDVKKPIKTLKQEIRIMQMFSDYSSNVWKHCCVMGKHPLHMM